MNTWYWCWLSCFHVQRWRENQTCVLQILPLKMLFVNIFCKLQFKSWVQGRGRKGQFHHCLHPSLQHLLIHHHQDFLRNQQLTVACHCWWRVTWVTQVNQCLKYISVCMSNWQLTTYSNMFNYTKSGHEFLIEAQPKFGWQTSIFKLKTVHVESNGTQMCKNTKTISATNTLIAYCHVLQHFWQCIWKYAFWN